MHISSVCRRTTIAVVVLATATLFAGCGADSTRAAGGLTEETLVPALTKAMRANVSAHVTLSLAGGGQGIKAAGDVTGTGGRRKLQATFTGKELGGKLTLRNIVGSIYLRLEGKMPAGKFLMPDRGKKEDADVIKQMRTLSDYVDPVHVVRQMEGAVESVEPKGHQKVHGIQTTDYAVEVDASKVLNRMASNTLSKSDLSDLPERVRFHLLVDDRNLLHRMKLDITGLDYTFESSRWGRPVKLHKPSTGALLPQ